MGTSTIETTLGELISSLYSNFMDIYQDEELASLAVSTTLNELFIATAAERADAREVSAA